MRLTTALGTRIKLSHLFRSCLTLLRHSEEHLLRRARKARGLIRPPNNDAISLSEFEDALTDMECLPESLAGTRFYEPTNRGVEQKIAERLEAIRARKNPPK